MKSRRAFLSTGAAGAVAATAGCLDFILGDDLSFSASEASVSDAALQETEYEKRRTKQQTFEKSFEVGGESRSVTVTNVYAEYDRSIDLSGIGGGDQRAATFTAASTPKVEVLGQTFNPIKEMSAAEILRRAQNRYDGFGNVQQRSELTATVLGSETKVTRFTGDAELYDSGLTVEIELQVSEVVGSGDDYVLAVGGYPRRLADSGRENYETLAAGIQHDG